MVDHERSKVLRSDRSRFLPACVGDIFHFTQSNQQSKIRRMSGWRSKALRSNSFSFSPFILHIFPEQSKVLFIPPLTLHSN